MNKTIRLSFFRSRRGSVLNLVLIGLLTLIILGVGSWVYLSGGSSTEMDEPLTAQAFRGLFVKEVLDQGEIQSSDNVEIRSQVKSRYGSRGVTVKWVIEEGKKVKSGDVLVELRSDEIQENFDNQQIEVNNAADALLAADNTLQAAEVALKEYEEGVYQEAKITIENEISEATSLLEQAVKYYDFSKKLLAKGFIQPDELRSDQLAVDRARNSLVLAKKKLNVLEDYTSEKFKIELGSDIEIARGKVYAAEENLKIEQRTLREIEEQLDACTIRCPWGELQAYWFMGASPMVFIAEEKAGTVVHANIFSRRGNSEFILEEGASVREGQVLVKLPNPKKMQVKATVNESRVTSILEGMAVVISVDALNGQKLDGVVTKVNQYAEPEGWGGGGVRKYGVFVDILNPGKDIKPGMNTSVLIETERNENALLVPIQAVYGYRGKTFCLEKKGGTWETVEVEVGSNNDTNIVILSGLEEGATVAMNPGAFKSLMNLPDLPEVKEEKGPQKKQSKKGSDRGKGPKKKGNGNANQDETRPRDAEESGSQDKRSPSQYPASGGKKGQPRDSGPNSETAKSDQGSDKVDA